MQKSLEKTFKGIPFSDSKCSNYSWKIESHLRNDLIFAIYKMINVIINQANI